MNNDTPDDDRTVARSTSGDALPPTASAPSPVLPKGRNDSGNALPLGTYLDEFELRSVAGEGGFSIVYRAWDHSLKRQVAVKEYFPSGMVGRSGGTQVVVRSERHTEAFEAGLRSFVEEARLLAQFDHPALIKVYRFWKANGSAYMVMPFCEGITLRDDWRANPDPPDEQALMTLLDPLTDALAVLHAERWYHRDIAPDNVMLLAGTRKPLLLDFGAARQVIGDMTHALTVILKPGYAPIEQWGEVPGMNQGPWTDVYALGALIHFAIMRRTPPPSVGRLVNDGYEPLVQVAAGRYSQRFLAAVDHALAVRPELRTQTIQQFRDEIGLNEFARDPRTLAWMPAPHPAATLPDLALPDSQLPTVAVPPAPRPSSGVEFTVRQPTAPAPQAEMAASPPPAPRTNPALLFAAGLVVTGVLGLGGYALLKPGTAPQPAPSPGPMAASAPAAPASRLALPSPPEPASVPAPTPTPAPDFNVSAEFERARKAQTPGHVVEVNLVRSTVRSDKDALSLTLKSSQEGYVYLFNRGSDGSLLQIYPNKRSGLLRIRKDTPIELPRQTDDELKITGPTGTNDMLFMVSKLPRELPTPARTEHGYAWYQIGPAGAAIAAKHSGPLPWFVGKPKCAAGASCDDEFGAAIATLNIVQ